MIRILRIVSVMDRGGIETQIMNIFRNIDRKKYQFDFLITREQTGYFDNEILSLGGKIYKVNSVRKVGLFEFISSISSFFKSHSEYKIVHSHMNTWSGLFLLIAKFYKVPIRIAHSHSAQSNVKKIIKENFFETILKNIMRSMIKFSATDFWAVGNSASLWLYGKTITNKNSLILPNAKIISKFLFNDEIRGKLRSELSYTSENFVIAMVGSFTPIKNHLFIISIIPFLISKNSNLRFIILGDGLLKEKYIQLVHNNQLDNFVKILSTKDNINEFYSSFDLIVHPSLFEGVPNVLLEAQISDLDCLISSFISKDVDLNLLLLKYLPLTIEKWIEEILKSSYKKKIRSNKIKISSEIDLKLQIEFLERFYSKIL